MSEKTPKYTQKREKLDNFKSKYPETRAIFFKSTTSISKILDNEKGKKVKDMTYLNLHIKLMIINIFVHI